MGVVNCDDKISSMWILSSGKGIDDGAIYTDSIVLFMHALRVLF